MLSGWFMRAFWCASTNQYVTAVELYRQALEILEWGRQDWKDVTSNDRGTIFEITYVRGVKRFYMTALMEVGKFREPKAFLILCGLTKSYFITRPTASMVNPILSSSLKMRRRW